VIDKDGIPLDNIGYFCNELIITGLPFVSSVDNVIEQFDISIFPNPAFDKVQINTDLSVSGSFNLIDLNGRMIFTEETSNLKSNTLNLSNLSPGIYFLSIQNEKNELQGVEN